MIYALVEYMNGKGKKIVKGVSTQADLDAMIANLDSRIQKGTCLGYLVTII